MTAVTAAVGTITAARSRTRRRGVVVGVVVGTLIVVAACIAMLAGDYPLSPLGVLEALLGSGSRIDQAIVTQVRLPRLVMGAACGVALGLAGALLQTLLRNPLASPDLLGVSGGASVGAVWATLVLGATGVAVAGYAVAGALVVAVVLLVAARRLSDGGYRLVLAGVGISFLCAAVVGYLLKRAQVQLAQSATVWITGSLGATRWSDVLVLAAALVLAVPAVVIAGRTLPVLQLGDPLAGGLGTIPARARAAIVTLAVVISAVPTAFIGPVGFIALCAPPIARALLGHGAVGLGAGAAVGAFLLVAADLVGQYALPGVAVPVGVVTGAVGAPYLLWILATSKGRRS